VSGLDAIVGEVWADTLEAEGIDFTIDYDQTCDSYVLMLTGLGGESRHELSCLAMREALQQDRLIQMCDNFIKESLDIHKEQFGKKEIPLFTEAVVGYRQWRLDDWVLSPINYGTPYRPGVNEAVCNPNVGFHARQRRLTSGNYTLGHEAPAKDCHCGFNAFHDFEKMNAASFANKEHGTVTGAIIGWGNLEVHSNGFRSQFCRIVALVGNGNDNLNEIAELYKVPLVDTNEELQIEASNHGTPLPESLRPRKKPSLELQSNVRGYTSGGYVATSVGGTLPAPVSYHHPKTGNPYTHIPSAFAGAAYQALKKEYESLKQPHRYGPASTHTERMDEMLGKIKEINESKSKYEQKRRAPKKLPKWMRYN